MSAGRKKEKRKMKYKVVIESNAYQYTAYHAMSKNVAISHVDTARNTLVYSGGTGVITIYFSKEINENSRLMKTVRTEQWTIIKGQGTFEVREF